jgi:hypothetical protein
MKQNATPAKPDTGDFAGRAPVEQRAAADWQFRQQLFFVNEANLGGWLRDAGIKNKLLFHKLPFFAGNMNQSIAGALPCRFTVGIL